ncbi:hypothetical protein Hanom_Chr12g01075071 [Helianthus anomalus]
MIFLLLLIILAMNMGMLLLQVQSMLTMIIVHVEHIRMLKHILFKLWSRRLAAPASVHYAKYNSHQGYSGYKNC